MMFPGRCGLTRRVKAWWGPFLAWIATLSCGAHPLLQNTWWVRVEGDRLVMRVSSTLREVVLTCGPEFGTHVPTNLTGWQPALVQQGAYLRQHLRVHVDEREVESKLIDWSIVADSGAAEASDSTTFLDETRATFDLECPGINPDQPHRVVFSANTLEELRYAPGISWEVVYAIAVKDSNRRSVGSGVVRNGVPFTVELPAVGKERLESAGTLPTTAPTLRHLPEWGFLTLGIHHILTGYDHLLFLAALALAAVRWVDYIRLIVLFTAAHSLTVTFSVLQWVHLPPWFVEPFIAISIILIALENGLMPQRSHSNWRMLTAFGFGLVHGLGFATGLSEALGGSSGQSILVAILGFCVGVEIGHLVVGVPFWTVIRWSSDRWGDRVHARIQRIGSAVVALGGAYFLMAAVRLYG